MNAMASHFTPSQLLFQQFDQDNNKETLKIHIIGHSVGGLHWLPVTGEFPTQRASYAENVSIWWRHHELTWFNLKTSCSCDTIAVSTIRHYIPDNENARILSDTAYFTEQLELVYGLSRNSALGSGDDHDGMGYLYNTVSIAIY